MPIIQTSNPWADAMLALSGEAQGFQAGRQQQFQNQLQTDEQKQQKLQQQAEQEYRDKQLRLQAGEYGLDPNTGQPLPTNVKYDPMPTNPKPGDLAAWADTQLAKAAAANDVAGVTRFRDAANALSQTDVREQGTIPLDQARRDEIRNEIAHKYRYLYDRLQGEQKLRAMAAYHRAGGGRAGNTGEREAIALATALNAANKEEYSVAASNARDQVREDISFYEKTYNPTTGQGYNMQTGGMSPNPPSTTINVAPPTVYTVVNGQMVPVDPNTGKDKKPAPTFHGLPVGTKFTSNGKPMIVGPDGKPRPDSSAAAGPQWSGFGSP